MSRGYLNKLRQCASTVVVVIMVLALALIPASSALERSALAQSVSLPAIDTRAVPSMPDADPPAPHVLYDEDQPPGMTNVSVDAEGNMTAMVTGPLSDGAPLQPSDCTLPPPDLISPVGGVQVNTLGPYFRWSRTGDGYAVQISTTSSFSTLVYSTGWGFPPGMEPNVLMNFNLLPNTTYYWRVASSCGGGLFGPFSSPALFSTGNVTGPFVGPPTLISPANGAVQASMAVSCSWGNVPGATRTLTRYYNSLTIAQNDDQWHRSPSAAAWSGAWHQTGGWTFQSPGTYYWRVSAGTDAGWGPLSPVRSFRISGTPSITHVEINQVLGYQYQGAQKYVAGKDTAIRVYLAASITTSSSSQRVEVRRNGSLVTTLYPQPSPHPTDVLTFMCPNRAVCGDWQEGDYTFRATVGPNTSQKTATFAPRRALRILAVPVRVNDQGTIRTPDASWKSGGVFLRHVYPVAADGVEWKIGSELDASNLDLTTDWDQRWLWAKVRLRQPLHCLLGVSSSSCYDMIVGFIPAMRTACTTQCEACSCSVGWTYGKPATIVMTNGSFATPCPNRPTIEINDMRSTVAHEFGHTFDNPLGDEYNHPFGKYRCGINPPPPDYEGTYWGGTPTCNSADKCTDSSEQPWPHETGSGSLVGSLFARPFEINPTMTGSPARGALPDMLSFMGSGRYQRDMWVTPRTYNHLYDQLAPTLMSEWTPASSVDAVSISGWVGQDGSVGLDPWYRFSVPLVDPVTGAYSVEAVNGLGQVLASQGFDVSFTALSNPPQIIDPAPFEALVDFPPGTVAFRIKHGVDILAEVPVSLHTPTVQVTAPAAGQVLSGPSIIAWQSQDADGDTLYHTVEYSLDGQEWQVLGSAITQTQFTADFSTLPGGATAQVRVIVSDGVNTATATSEAFTVVHTPPEVSIYAPASGSMVPWASLVTLSGGAYDYRDGWLRDQAVVTWSSDRDGVLGGGENLHVSTLSPGLHTITLAATNSVSLVSSATMILTVGMPGDLNGDGCILVDDIAAVATVWLQETNAPLDLNGDGVITIADVMVVAAQWDGLCVPE